MQSCNCKSKTTDRKMEKSHCCKDNTTTQYSPPSKLLADDNYLILRNPLRVFISGLFLQIEKPKPKRLNALSKVTVGELRCLSCAAETELDQVFPILL